MRLHRAPRPRDASLAHVRWPRRQCSRQRWRSTPPSPRRVRRRHWSWVRRRVRRTPCSDQLRRLYRGRCPLPRSALRAHQRRRAWRPWPCGRHRHSRRRGRRGLPLAHFRAEAALPGASRARPRSCELLWVAPPPAPAPKLDPRAAARVASGEEDYVPCAHFRFTNVLSMRGTVTGSGANKARHALDKSIVTRRTGIPPIARRRGDRMGTLLIAVPAAHAQP